MTVTRYPEGATSLDGLGDVAVSSASRGQILAHNGTLYRNRSQGIVDVRDWGAVGDGVVDDSTALDDALAAAIAARGSLYLPGTSAFYLRSTDWVIAGSGVVIFGDGPGRSIVRVNATDEHCVTLGEVGTPLTSALIRDISFETGSAAGHVFNQVGTVSRCLFSNVNATQNATAKRIHSYNNTANGFLDNLWRKFEFTMPSTTTVEAVWLYSTKGDLNANIWESGRVNNSRGTAPFFRIENDTNTTYAFDNVFRRITGEVMIGGMFGLYQCHSTLLEHCEWWDGNTVGNSTNDMVFVGRRTGAANGKSVNTRIVQCGNRSSPLGTGFSDIKLQAAAATADFTTIEGAQDATLAALVIDCGSAGNSGRISGVPVTTLSNAGGFSLTYRNTTRTCALSTGNLPSPSAVNNGPGHQAYDTTLDRPVWVNSSSASWRSAALLEVANTFSAATTFSVGYQATATARTATTDGTGTGTIAAGTSFVTVTCDDANKIIILPAPVIGNIVRLMNGATGYELRTSNPTSIGINGGGGSGAESAIPASTLVECHCTTANAWVCMNRSTNGTVSATEVAAP